MKQIDVPQDDDKNYEGKSRLRYARTHDGFVAPIKSSGWTVESEATQLAWDEINQELLITLKQVRAGKLSPLAYHMQQKLLTPELLAANIGRWSFLIKRDMLPKKFMKLSNKTLERYANFLAMTVDELKRIPNDES